MLLLFEFPHPLGGGVLVCLRVCTGVGLDVGLFPVCTHFVFRRVGCVHRGWVFPLCTHLWVRRGVKFFGGLCLWVCVLGYCVL